MPELTEMLPLIGRRLAVDRRDFDHDKHPVGAAEAPGSGDSSFAGAVILGGTHGSLAVARSLGRKGIRVWLVEEGRGIASFSRFVERRLAWAGAGAGSAVDWLLSLARREGIEGWVLFPAGDSEVRLVASNRDRLKSVFRLTTQSWPILEQVQDKALLYARAAALGLDIPARYIVPRGETGDPRPDRFPVVIKPAMREERNALTIAKAWRADDALQFAERYRAAVSLMPRDQIIVQELIPGDGTTQFSYAGLWHDGRPLASLTARRLRQYPIEFGYTSTFVDTVEAPIVEAASERLLASLHYRGLAEVEFKYDARDGKYKILDVNTRMWSWIGLGEAAGVDFPYLAWQIATGGTVTPVRGKAGFTWRHTVRDLVAGFHEVRLGRVGLSGYATSLRQPGVSASTASDDRVPGLLDVPLTAGRLLGRLAR